METTMSISAETMTCPDCHQPMHTESYLTWKHETRTTHTCKTVGWLLNSVTLTAHEWNHADLESYRKMNRKG